MKSMKLGCAVAVAATLCLADTPSALVHRWSFNGNYDDTGSGTPSAATPVGDAGTVFFNSDNTMICMQAPGANNSSYNKGHVNLGANLIPTDTDGATIEIFATLRQARMWERIFSYGNGGKFTIDMCWTQNSTVDQDLAVFTGINNQNNTMAPFTLDTQWHISVVLKKDGNGGTWIRWMRRSVSTGEIVKHNSARTGTTIAAVGENPPFSLGGSLFSKTDDAYADYDEVRIWNVALDDGQLSANAKAGPDVIPNVVDAEPDSWVQYVSTEDGEPRYIDTCLVGRSGTKVEAKFRQTSSTSSWPVLIGVDGSANNTRFHPIAFYYNNQLHFQYRAVKTSLIYNPGGYGKDLVVTSDYKADGSATATVKDAATGAELANVSKGDMGEALDTQRNMYLFACNGNTWLSDYFFGRCHYVKIWQTNASGEYVLVRDYVPCLKDGMAGMYDNVSHTISYPVGRPFGYELVGAAVRAVWNGSDANAILPGNWLCYDSASALIANAVPSSGTIVTVDRADPAPTVVDGSTLSWSATTIGGSAVGKVAQTGGSLNLMSGTLGANEGSQGTYEASGGSLVSGDFFLGQPGTGTINANGSASMQFSKLYIGNTRGGKGNINIGGDASITISGYSTLGQSAGSYGEVNQTGGTVTTGTHGDGFNIGRDGIGTYNLSGGTLNVRQLLRVGWGGGTSECVFNMSGDSTLNLSNALSVGDWAKNCQFNMAGGTINGHKLYIGGYSGNSTGSGAFVQDGGDVVLDDTIIIGSAKGTGSYTMNGGKITEKWWIQLGQDNVGTFTQNGGDIVLTGAGGHSWLCLAYNRSGNGTYVMNGGTLTIATGIEFGHGANGGTGRFEMTGGTVTVPTIQRADAANATLVLNGGVLRATSSNAEFIKNIGEVTVGGVTFDTSEAGHELGVTPGTTFRVAAGSEPALKLAGAGKFGFSGVKVEFEEKPTRPFIVIQAETADAIDGMPELAVSINGINLVKVQGGTQVMATPQGTLILVR